MNQEIQKCISALQSRHIKAILAEDTREARVKILELIPPDAVVGIGDSTAIKQMDLVNLLKDRGHRILDPFEKHKDAANPAQAETERRKIQREATLCDVFLTGTNALTLDGRLVNMDATGNRVAGMVWGHSISVIVVGRNKIVQNLDEAVHRIRKVIAPTHLQIRTSELGGRKRKAPCAVTGECSDCRAIDKICNILMIIEGKPTRTDLFVVIVNEDLGLGFDPSWPEERIRRILDTYRRFVWTPPNIDPSNYPAD